MELTGLTATTSKTAEFSKVLPVDDVDDVIAEISDVHAALLRICREIYRSRRSADGLWSNMDLTHKTTLADFALRV